MNFRKFIAWKDIFSYRQKVALLVTGGIVMGLVGLFMYMLRMHTYIIGDDPAACASLVPQAQADRRVT